MTTQNKKKIDPLMELSRVPRKLYSRMFRRCELFYSEHLNRWTCTIEYGFGNRVFGTGKSPHRAMLDAMDQVNEMLKEKESGS